MIQGFQVCIISFNILHNDKWVLLIDHVLDERNLVIIRFFTKEIQ